MTDFNDFSGGQIENIARHYAIDAILRGTNNDVLPMLIQHCDNERLDEKNSRKKGITNSPLPRADGKGK